MNTIVLNDSQISVLIFSCLALLNSPLENQSKITELEIFLLTKVIENNQPLPVPRIGFELFDNAAKNYAAVIETRLKGIDMSNVNTGSNSLNIAFTNRLNQIISLNFPPITVDTEVV